MFTRVAAISLCFQFRIPTHHECPLPKDQRDGFKLAFRLQGKWKTVCHSHSASKTVQVFYPLAGDSLFCKHAYSTILPLQLPILSPPVCFLSALASRLWWSWSFLLLMDRSAALTTFASTCSSCRCWHEAVQWGSRASLENWAAGSRVARTCMRLCGGT